jgi:hypothetical protein
MSPVVSPPATATRSESFSCFGWVAALQISFEAYWLLLAAAASQHHQYNDAYDRTNI